jgi:moderate conductance mechanosensitive channel
LTFAAATPLITGQTDQGYVHDLLRQVGASEFIARTVQFIVVRPLEILLIVVVALVAGRLGARVARRTVRSLRNRTRLDSLSPRASLRVETIGTLVASLWRGVVWIIAGLTILGVLGINLTPILAGATVIGAALGFGAQSLVRDFLSGFFIIAEDQYGVGDAIAVGETKAITGVVEEVNLRITRVRALDGTVWYIPNGEIRKVGNSSIEWARAVVDIVVPLGTDVERASTVAGEESAAVVADPAWASMCQGAPELWGVDSMDPTAVTIRVVVRTATGQKDTVARAIRSRVSARLQHEGIVSPPS